MKIREISHFQLRYGIDSWSLHIPSWCFVELMITTLTPYSSWKKNRTRRHFGILSRCFSSKLAPLLDVPLLISVLFELPQSPLPCQNPTLSWKRAFQPINIYISLSGDAVRVLQFPLFLQFSNEGSHDGAVTQRVVCVLQAHPLEKCSPIDQSFKTYFRIFFMWWLAASNEEGCCGDYARCFCFLRLQL